MRQLLKITSIFALALVFTAGTVLAQQDVDVDQIGDKNIQISDFNANTGYEVDVTQDGNRNFAKVVQFAGPANQGSGYDIDQIQEGNDNDARAQVNHGSRVLQKQIGDQNEALIEKWDSGNSARQIQTGGDMNIARALTSNRYGRGSASLFHRQHGSKNLIVVEVDRGHGTGIDMRQFGNRNTSKVLNLSDGSSVTSSVATYQDGNDNLSRVWANSHYGSVDVTQTGDQNTARATFTNNFSLNVTQDGFDNRSIVR